MNSGDVKEIEKEVEEIIAKELENIRRFTQDLAMGKYPVC